MTTLKEHKIKSDLFPQIISGYVNLKYLFTFRAGPNSETDGDFFKTLICTRKSNKFCMKTDVCG